MTWRHRLFATLLMLLAALPVSAQGEPRFSETRLIVKFRSVSHGGPTLLALPHRAKAGESPRVGHPEIDRLLQRFDIDAMEPLAPPTDRNRDLRERLGIDRFRVLRARRPIDVPAAVRAFQRARGIELVEPDYIVKAADAAAPTLIPNDPLFPTQWHLRNSGGNTGPIPGVPGADIHIVPAWDALGGDPGVPVSVLDSGLRLDHPEFAGRLWNNDAEIPDNHLDDDGNGYVDDVNGFDVANLDGDPSDDYGHGTAVTSVLAATGNNNRLIAGVDLSCRIVTVKVLNSAGFGYYSWWAAGILYSAAVGARVINMSLVGDEPSGTIAAALLYARESGCLTVAAMGNSNSSSPLTPARYDAVLAVGSTDPQDDRCIPAVCGYGSNTGPHIDVVAPGTHISVLSYLNLASVAYGGGTSFATPQAAGLASLLLARFRNLGPDALGDVVRFSADDHVGREEEDTPGFDLYHGYGRINAERALQLAPSVSPPTVTAPATVSGAEGGTITVLVTASDPDGDPIQSLTADLSALPPGSDATFTTGSNGASGTLQWMPGYSDAGDYLVVFTAASPFRGRATTLIQVANVNDPPVIDVSEELGGGEGQELAVQVTATDPDGDPIGELFAEPLPAGAAFETTPDRRAGLLRWRPGYDQAGLYPIRFVVRSPIGSSSDYLETAASRTIEITDVDTPPAVTTLAPVNGTEGIPIAASVSAADSDGDPLTALSAHPLPEGATFVAAPDFATGLFTWTPGFAQSGTYSVNVTTRSAHTAPGGGSVTREGSAVLLLIIADTPDHPPVVQAATDVQSAEGSPLQLIVTASDPDGDEMLALTASPLPAGASFTANASYTAATLDWTPDFDQERLYPITLSARSAHRASPVSEPIPLEGFALVTITVANTDRAPSVNVPPSVVVDEGQPVAFTVSALDPDGEAVASLVMNQAPLGATFQEDPSHATGLFQWSPGYADAGSHLVGFEASNALIGHGEATIEVRNVNQRPEADPGGPYAGVVDLPIAFDGTGSSDPDGSALTYAWDFGDQSPPGDGPTASHTYVAVGTYPVTLTASDGELSGSAATLATVEGVFLAWAFPDAQDRVIRLMAAKRTSCLRVEPVGSSYDNPAVEVGTLTLISPGTGTVDRIRTVLGKTSPIEDQDRNGVAEVGACFSKESLRELFGNLPPGSHHVPVTLEGELSTGGTLRSTLDLEVAAAGGSLTASFAPIPTRGDGVLSIHTERAGQLVVRLFDASGRMVRELRAGGSGAAAGYVSVAFDGRDASGRELRSGIYFYRIESAGEVSTGRLILLR